MAFRDTSERYEYIYGSSVRKLDRESAGSPKSGNVKQGKNYVRKPERSSKNRTGTVNTEVAAVIQKNRARFLAFDWKYTFVAVMAVILCASAAMFYLHGTVQLNVMERQISELKTEKATLLSKQNALQAEIDKSINLDEIKEYAEKNLHMIYPKDSNVLLYKGESDDYFRQYESVNAGK